MAPVQSIMHQPISIPSSNFFVQNSVTDLDLNFNNYVNDDRRYATSNLDLMTFLTFNNSQKNRLRKLDFGDSFDKLREMKLKGRLNAYNEHKTSTESLLLQHVHENYGKTPMKSPPVEIRRVKTEGGLLNKLDYDYKREQKCLLEFKDKISEVEEEYNELLNKQKEKEKRLKERVQKLKKRFQVVIRFHSYFAKTTANRENQSQSETKIE